MYTKLWFIVVIIALVLVLVKTGLSNLNFKGQIGLQTIENNKVEANPNWQKIFVGKPVLTLLGQCEAPDGKGGIDLNAYNPKDTDGKEKFGCLQFDKETFYGGVKRFGLKDANINDCSQQIWLAEKYITNHEYWRWPTCWNKIFPR
mgnify:CR=1 FL=1